VALLRKETCNLWHPMHFCHLVTNCIVAKEPLSPQNWRIPPQKSPIYAKKSSSLHKSPVYAKEAYTSAKEAHTSTIQPLSLQMSPLQKSPYLCRRGTSTKEPLSLHKSPYLRKRALMSAKEPSSKLVVHLRKRALISAQKPLSPHKSLNCKKEPLSLQKWHRSVHKR